MIFFFKNWFLKQKNVLHLRFLFSVLLIMQSIVSWFVRLCIVSNLDYIYNICFKKTIVFLKSRDINLFRYISIRLENIFKGTFHWYKLSKWAGITVNATISRIKQIKLQKRRSKFLHFSGTLSTSYWSIFSQRYMIRKRKHLDNSDLA